MISIQTPGIPANDEINIFILLRATYTPVKSDVKIKIISAIIPSSSDFTVRYKGLGDLIILCIINNPTNTPSSRIPVAK